MIVGLGPLLDVVPDLLVGLDIFRGQELLEDESLVRLAAHHLSAPAEPFQRFLPVVGIGEEGRIDGRGIIRVRSVQRDGANTAGP